MAELMADVSRGAFTYAAPTLPLLLRALEIDRSHQGLGLGLVDASIAALAETLRVTRIATRDVRHFSAIHLRGGMRFELVVHPRRPDR